MREPEKASGIQIEYPQSNTLFPPEFSPPTFRWQESNIKTKNWEIIISDSLGKIFFREDVISTFWKPDSLVWADIKMTFKTDPIQLFVFGKRKWSFNRELSSAQINFSFSEDSVGSPVFFRAVPLPFGYAVKHVDEIQWYMASVEDKQPKLMLEKIPVCANCHSFTKRGSLLAMDVDYANDKGSYAIAPIIDSCILSFERIITWSDYKRYDGEETFGLLSQISPDGKNVLSTVKDRSVFVPVDNNLAYSQLFFPIKGILACYNRETKRFSALPGANNPSLVQSNPVWSPDGRTILFSRAQRYYSDKIEKTKSVLLEVSDVQEFIKREKNFKFDIYSVPFNNGEGGVPQALPGASGNNKSNYFPKYSPDGKWIVFCQAENFMLLQPDSKLYIIPAAGGDARLMNCNTENMNSWHSWSPNSKWLVFSSKKNGAYTQLFLTHVDSMGNDSPAVLLENMVFTSRAINIPEFFPGDAHKFLAVKDKFSQSAQYYTRLAIKNNNDANYKSALQNIAKAIELDSNYFDAYLQRIKINRILRQEGLNLYKNDREKALTLINSKINSKLQEQGEIEEVLLQRADLFLLIGDYENSIRDAKKVLNLNPKNFHACVVLSSGYKLLERYLESIPFYEKLIKINPDSEKQFAFFIALAYQKAGETTQAYDYFSKLTSKYPDNYDIWMGFAALYIETKDISNAEKALEKAIELDPQNYLSYLNRSDLYMITRQKQKAKIDYDKAIELLSDKMSKQSNDVNLWFARAEIYESAKLLTEALANYESVLLEWPNNYNALKQSARIYIGKKNWDRAIITYQLLLKNYPAEMEFYNNLALVNIELKNTNDAFIYFSKALEIEPENMELLYNRGQLHLKTGNIEKAKKDFRKLKEVLVQEKSKSTKNPDTDKLLLEVDNILNRIGG